MSFRPRPLRPSVAVVAFVVATLLVGISVPMGPQLVPSLLLASHLKAARPQVKVVLGGPTLSLMDTTEIESLLLNPPDEVWQHPSLYGCAHRHRARAWLAAVPVTQRI